MNNRAEQAMRLHDKGYNCAQAVACAYCDLFEVDEQTMYRMSEGFGLGMGMMEVCGAMSGAFMLAGLKGSAGVEAPGATKAKTYATNRELCKAFQDKNGSLLCRELKGVASGTRLRSCAGCIEDACTIVEKFLID